MDIKTLNGLRPCRKTSNRRDGRSAAPAEDSTHGSRGVRFRQLDSGSFVEAW